MQDLSNKQVKAKKNIFLYMIFFTNIDKINIYEILDFHKSYVSNYKSNPSIKSSSAVLGIVTLRFGFIFMALLMAKLASLFLAQLLLDIPLLTSQNHH